MATGAKIKRFALIGHERCGSSMLMLSLARHPAVRMHVELFHNDETYRQRYFLAEQFIDNIKHGSSRHRPIGRYYRTGEDSNKFLEETVFYPRPVAASLAIGFKIFYHHARSSPAAQKVWMAMHRRQRTFKIIHIFREDIIGAWLSREIALRSGRWIVGRAEPGHRVEIAPFKADIAGCLRYLDHLHDWRAWTRHTFRQHAYIELEYTRDIMLNYAETIDRVLGFLEVDRCELPVETRRQAGGRVLAEQITNFEELKAALLRTHHRNSLLRHLHP